LTDVRLHGILHILIVLDSCKHGGLIMMTAEEKYISLKDAAEKLGMKRPSLHYYIDHLKMEKKQFPLDRERYITLSDFERIKQLREEAAARKSVSE
jgi:biotin operon repressor